MKKEINTLFDYMIDETRVTKEERERINFQVAFIGKMLKVREEKKNLKKKNRTIGARNYLEQ